ncbi:hypothetical protein JCM10207_002841 [Rhodosporidiobolus poonsookiae]
MRFLSVAALLSCLSAIEACAADKPGGASRFLPSSPSFGKRSSMPPRLRKRDIPRAVFAHVVQGDFQGYSQDSYAADMAMAKEAGIAAFALNVGNDASGVQQLKLAFAAAEASSFSLFFSFDMNYFHDAGSSDTILENYLKPYGGSSAHYLVDGKVLVSTFSGETSSTFLDGAGSLADSTSKWQALFDSAKSAIGKELTFWPDYNDVNAISQASWDGGIMSWAAWGDKGRTGDMTTSGDESYLSAASTAGLQGYIAPVSAFFFVHVAEGNNYVLQSSDFLLPNHYTDLINLESGPAFIELLSWNDFGEAHYLGPVRDDAGVPSTATGYADSKHDHTPVLWASAYYNLWFTNGSPPNIKTEAIVWYYRPHPAGATASSDSLAAPDYADTLEDKIYALVFVPSGSEAAKLVITTGGSATDAQDVKEGVNLISVDFQAGATGVSLQDTSGNEILSGTGDDINGSPSTYDFNFKSYILPEDATASTFLDGTSSSGTTSQGAGETTTAAAATTNGGTGTSSVSMGTSSTSAGLPGSSTGASSHAASGTDKSADSSPSHTSPASSSPSDASSSSASSASSSPLSATYAGLPLWGWLVGATLVLVAIAIAVVALRQRPASRRGAKRLRSASESSGDSDSGSGSESGARSSEDEAGSSSDSDSPSSSSGADSGRRARKKGG